MTAFAVAAYFMVGVLVMSMYREAKFAETVVEAILSVLLGFFFIPVLLAEYAGLELGCWLRRRRGA